MRLFRPGFIAECLYPEAIFRIKTTEKLLVLTFDDGPHPDSTPQILNILDSYSIKALFFCRGDAAEKYPQLVNEILSKGHIIGNHGYNHIKGWKTSNAKYIADIERAALFTSDKLFRPPFGSLSFRQYRSLKEKYKIIFWDIMPYDFDPSFGGDESLQILKSKIRNGSVIVLHDKPDSSAKIFLSEFLTFAVNEGYKFEARFRI
jgi:peptidoglycan/xylan/chitin deacetylase (PgdA/CDA1 family)